MSLDALDVAARVRSGALRARAVAEASLALCEKYGGASSLGAVLATDEAGALRAAECLDRALEEARKSGKTSDELAARWPLAGATVAVKDSLMVRGVRATCGSKMLADHIAAYDAHAVERLRAAGAIVVAKSNMDEFAMGSSTENSAFFPAKNPWDRARTPGGSSGGSAVCVAAGLTHLALGSDTGGSVRQPASLSGCVGLRPTYGRISRYGLVAFASSLDTVGVLARNVRDAAALYEAIAGHDPRDSSSARERVRPSVASEGSLRGLRVGVVSESFSDEMQSEVRSLVRDALSKIEARGATLVPLSMPHARFAVASYCVLAAAEASSNLSRFDGVRYGLRADADNVEALYRDSRAEGFGDEVKRRILLGTFALSAGYYDAHYRKAQRARSLIANDFREAFSSVDVIASPTSPCVAWPLGERLEDPLSMYLADLCTLPASLAGVPALSVYCGSDARGLPVGLQLASAAFTEHALLSVAEAVERCLGRALRPSMTGA